jgi:hypothetical protein
MVFQMVALLAAPTEIQTVVNLVVSMELRRAALSVPLLVVMWVALMEILWVVHSVTHLVVYLAVRKVYWMVAQMADSMVVMLAAC